MYVNEHMCAHGKLPIICMCVCVCMETGILALCFTFRGETGFFRPVVYNNTFSILISRPPMQRPIDFLVICVIFLHVKAAHVETEGMQCFLDVF